MLNISLLENKLTILFATIFSCLVAIFYSLYPNIAYGAEKGWSIQDYKNHYAEVQRSPELVQIIENEIENLPKGCLLYTSPSPRDRQKSRMPSSA